MTLNPVEVPSHFIERSLTEIQKLKELKRIQSECRETCRRAGDTQTVASYDKSIDDVNGAIAYHREIIMIAQKILEIQANPRIAAQHEDNNPGRH